MQIRDNLNKILQFLADMKAENISYFNVEKLTNITDFMIIVSGRSETHTKALSRNLVDYCKKNQYRPKSVEGDQLGEWICIDFVDIVVHIMTPKVRDFYSIEDLWDISINKETR